MSVPCKRILVALLATIGLGVLLPLTVGANVAQASGDHPGGMAMGGSWPGLPIEQIRADLDSVKASGARYIRLTMAWSSVERNKGTFRFNNLDTVVDEIHARDLEIIGLLTYTPAWARIDACSTSMFCRPKNSSDYRNYVKNTVRHFAPKGVHIWEMWNEPNIKNFWEPQPDPVFYTELLREGAAAARWNDPQAFILHAGLSPAPDATNGNRIHPKTFLEAVYAAGGKGSFDAMNMHPYSVPARPMYPASWNAFGGVMPMLRQVMVDRGDAGKQIWATEYGAPTAGQNSVDEQTAADFITEAFAQQDHWSWLGPIIVYNHRDLATDPHDREDHFGLRRFDGTPKAAYYAFRNAVTPASPSPTTAPSTTTAPPSTTTSTTAPPTTTTPPTTAAPTTTTTPPTTAAPSTTVPTTTPTTATPTPTTAPPPPAPTPTVPPTESSTADPPTPDLGPATFCTRVFCIKISNGTPVAPSPSA